MKFKDKETGKLNEPNTIIEVTEARLKEIQAAGKYVEVVKNTTKTRKKAE